MQDESCAPLGHLHDTEVGVHQTPAGQDILIQHTGVGQRVACLLGFGEATIIHLKDTPYWCIPHNPEVDKLLTEIIDLLISIRYAHPTLVQLEMELEP